MPGRLEVLTAPELLGTPRLSVRAEAAACLWGAEVFVSVLDVCLQVGQPLQLGSSPLSLIGLSRRSANSSGAVFTG